jgi:hypothetical protein
MGHVPEHPGISVALPIFRAGSTLRQAVGCITDHAEHALDLMLVLNGSDPATHALAHDLARHDRRIRVMTLPEPNLAAALNLAFEAAEFPLVARMDADDTCPPGRLKLQAEYLARHPEVAGVGCAWELAEPDGRVLTVVRPPTDPARLRWRLLLGNVLAHGSMMLHRDAVRRAGGYDTACARAQDYDLWLRLAGSLAALPDVLYRHRARFPGDPGRSTAEQAAVAAPRMLAAWRCLAMGHATNLDSALASALERGEDPARAVACIERELDSTGPTADALLAWLWTHWNTPPAPRRAAELCRRARVREIGARLRALGVPSIHLWGAGDHTRRMLQHPADLGVPIVGLVDDALAGQERFGRVVRHPADLRPSDHVLISTDWHEDDVWASSAPHRARGIRVFRLYADDAPTANNAP